MSSTITKSQLQSVPRTPKPSVEDKRERLIRTSSIERLRKFNTFICSQNYYILPALLCWLKTSQSILQVSTEACILFAKSLLFDSPIYRTLDARIKNIAPKGSFRFYNCRPSDLLPVLKMLLAVAYDSIHVVYESSRHAIFVAGVYAAICGIFLQLAVCVYVLSHTFLPGGLIFLFTCIYLISHINFSVLIHIAKTKEVKHRSRSDATAATRVIKPKQMLNNRTISNVKLF